MRDERSAFTNDRGRREASSLIPHPSSLIPHPSSLIPHPSSLIPHPWSASGTMRTDLNSRPATTPTAPNARSYQQVLTKLLRHGAYPQLRKIIEKTLPADIAPVIPMLLEEDRKRILSLLIEAGKAARALLELDAKDLDAILHELDDATLSA